MTSQLTANLLGLNVLSQKFPDGIITGPLPDSCKLPSRGQSLARQARSQPRAQFTAQPTVIHHNTFTPDDLDMLQDKLDDILLTESGNSSVFSSLMFSFLIYSVLFSRFSITVE